MMSDVARILVSLGVVAAAVGFVLLGMAMGFAETDHDLVRLSVVVMVVGGIAAVVGAILHRATENLPSQRPSRGEDSAAVGPTGSIRR